MDDKRDVHICGTCLKKFYDVEEFVRHKISNCSPPSLACSEAATQSADQKHHENIICASANKQTFITENNNVQDTTGAVASKIKIADQVLDFRKFQRVLSHDKQHLTMLLAAIAQQAGISLENLQTTGGVEICALSTQQNIGNAPVNSACSTPPVQELPMQSILVNAEKTQQRPADVSTSYVDILNVTTSPTATTSDEGQTFQHNDRSLLSQTSRGFSNDTSIIATTISSTQIPQDSYLKDAAPVSYGSMSPARDIIHPSLNSQELQEGNSITIDASQIMGVPPVSTESLQPFETSMAPVVTCHLSSGVHVITNPVSITTASQIDHPVENTNAGNLIPVFNEKVRNHASQVIMYGNDKGAIQEKSPALLGGQNIENVDICIKDAVLQRISNSESMDEASNQEGIQSSHSIASGVPSRPVMLVAMQQDARKDTVAKRNISLTPLSSGLDVKKNQMKTVLGRKSVLFSRIPNKTPNKGTIAGGQKAPSTKKFACLYTGCSYVASQAKDLNRHMYTHTGERPFSCKYCSKTFPRNDKLKIHLRLHTGERPYKCQLCDYAAAENGSLKKHLRIHTDERPFKCQVCPYASRNSSQLVVHLRTHTGDCPFQCQVCEAKFKINSDLKRHMRVHTGEKPFSCQYDCGYKCSIRANLKSHYKINHSLDKSFSCLKCDFRSSSVRPLKEHQKLHDASNPICCPTCNYICSSKGAFKNHQLVHSTDRPFKCEHCNFSARQRGNLKLHMKNRHSDKYQEVQKGKHRSVLVMKKTNSVTSKEDNAGSEKTKGFTNLKIKPSCKKLFNCSTCEASFVREDSLKAHLKQHKEIKQVLQSTALAVLQLQHSMPQGEPVNQPKTVVPQSGTITDSAVVSQSSPEVTETYVEVLATQSPVHSEGLDPKHIGNQINVLSDISTFQQPDVHTEAQQSYPASYSHLPSIVDEQAVINHIEIPESNIGLHSIATAACNMQAIPISTNSMPVTEAQPVKQVPHITNSVQGTVSLTPQVLSDQQCIMTYMKPVAITSETSNTLPGNNIIESPSHIQPSVTSYVTDDAGTIIGHTAPSIGSSGMPTGLSNITATYADSTATSMSQPLLVSSNLQLQGVLPQSSNHDNIQTHHVIQTPSGLQVSLLPLQDNISTIQQLPLCGQSIAATNPVTAKSNIISPPSQLQPHHIEVPVNIQIVSPHVEMPTSVNQLPIQIISPRLAGGLQAIDGNFQQNPIQVFLPQQYQQFQHGQSEQKNVLKVPVSLDQSHTEIQTIVVDVPVNNSQDVDNMNSTTPEVSVREISVHELS